ncbi:MAG: XRE family transcriptional regulator, partial [Verrucomicrobiaceae bacterium]
MRRHSKPKHPLAKLRLWLALGQKEMAALIGCSRATIQAVELGQLSLSDSLAETISRKTGVSARWLLAGDPNAPIIDITGSEYQPWRTRRPQVKTSQVPINLLSLYAQIRAIVNHLRNNHEVDEYLSLYTGIASEIRSLATRLGVDVSEEPCFIPSMVFSWSVDAIRADVDAYDENREKNAQRMETETFIRENWESYLGYLRTTALVEPLPEAKQKAAAPKKPQRPSASPAPGNAGKSSSGSSPSGEPKPRQTRTSRASKSRK